MKNKIISMGLCMLLCTGIVFQSNAVFASDKTKDLLKKTDIMTGDENGEFDDNGTLTREQFAKITVSIADPDYISTNSSAPFYDVAQSRWSSGYIDRANKLGFFHGYPDGSFRPDEEIVPEQACKVMLKLLGYDNENITGNWAMAQISLADSKGLLDNVNYSVSQPLTRIEAAKIIENTLLTQLKDSEKYLIEAMGYAYFEDAVLLTDKTTQSGYVSASCGIFKKNAEFDPADIGKKGDIIINKKSEILCFIPGNERYESYTVKTTGGDSIAVFGNNRAIEGISDETLCYLSGQQTNFANMKAALKTGDNLTVAYTDSGSIDYLLSSGNVMTAPKYINDIPVNDSTQYVRDGNSSSRDRIASLDVCYYLKDENTVIAYSKQITGVFENAYPSKENAASVNVSGTTYQIGYTSATNKLSSNGNIKYGDTITLLFGKDDTVVDVVKLSDNDKVYGVILKSALKDRLDENGNRLSEYAVSIMKTDGAVAEYSAYKDYDGYKGRAVSVTFKNSLAEIKTLNTNNEISGIFDWNKKKLGKYVLSDDIDIIDVSDNTDYTTAKGKKIYPQRLAGADLGKRDILFAEVENGEIVSLILNDYTNDLYDYGIMLYAKNRLGDYVLAGEYKVNINGSYSEFVTQNRTYPVKSGQSAIFEIDSVKGIVGMQSLNALSAKVTGVDDMYAYTNTREYRLADNVIVYNQVTKTGDSTGYRYEIIPKSSIDFEKSVTAYYDKAEKNGGRIRVIVVR